MSICSLNFIPILITVIFCGFLFVYFNTRLGEVKNTLEKQNRVLTSFITSVQNDIRGGSGSMGRAECPISSDYLASPEAVQAVQKLEREKIVVSDDEDDESDSEEESDDSESESDSDGESEEDGEENIKVIKLTKHSENMPPMEFELLSNEVLMVESKAVEVVEVHSEAHNAVANAVATEAVSASANAAAHEPLNLLNLIPMDDESLHADVNSISAYEHMKVDDLRKIVSDKSLASREEVKKLKKPELIALLKK
jgi:hypothetical protein